MTKLFAEDDQLKEKAQGKNAEGYELVQRIDKLTRDLKCSMGATGKALDEPWQ